MAKIIVTRFKVYDSVTDRLIQGKRPATYEALMRYCLSEWSGTEQEVDESWLDDQGFLKLEYCKDGGAV
jgi:hypothetical protein